MAKDKVEAKGIGREADPFGKIQMLCLLSKFILFGWHKFCLHEGHQGYKSK